MQTSENAPKVEGALNAEDSPNTEGVPNVEGTPTVESTEYRSGFYREAGFHDAHSLPDYGAQSPVTREAFAYDFFPATGDISSPAPLLVWVHGGAWRFGTNQALRDTVLHTPGGEQPNTQALMRAAFQQAGWAVASINYRYSHQALFPGALHDVKEAVRFFRANAHEFGIDPQRIAVAGGSAGGHLSMLVAHTGDSAAGGDGSGGDSASAPEHDEYYEGRAASAYPSHSSQVAAAASFYGVSDLRTIFTDRPLAGYALDHPEDDGAEWRLLGSTHPVPADVSTIDASKGERAVPGVCIERAQKNWERAHPIDAVRPQKRVNKVESASAPGASGGATALMLVHGISDSCVPYQQSVRVYQALRTRQVPTDLVLVPDAEHGDSRCFSPDIVQQMLLFLNRAVQFNRSV
ncbi:esterase [Rothia sp. HMSC066H02]|uniref:alpha/beta hydrolase n=1 Tax=Rothia TaxID=32207 RepID=UPI0008A2DEC0|nr:MULTISPECIES: alpha/beta hydrolase [Rothia]MBS4940139.1 alpha/beta hydrolase [Rothia mucilaginosa]OFO95129.1 esterase [Rothia sp. HMSC065D09]OFP11383.1 esterase [Rothia sp. HMSC066H02]